MIILLKSLRVKGHRFLRTNSTIRLVNGKKMHFNFEPTRLMEDFFLSIVH